MCRSYTCVCVCVCVCVTQVMDLIEEEWVYDHLPDDVGKLRAPVKSFTVPQRQQQAQIRVPRQTTARWGATFTEDDFATTQGENTLTTYTAIHTHTHTKYMWEGHTHAHRG